MSSSKLPAVSSPPWSVTTKRIVILVVLGLMFFMAQQVNAAAWNAIIVAVVLAYLLSPVVTFFERRMAPVIRAVEVRRTLAVLLTWLLLIGLITLMILLVVPATVSQARTFAEEVPEIVSDTEDALQDALDDPISVGDSEVVLWDELQGIFNGDEQTAGDGGDIGSRVGDTLTGLVAPALDVLGGALSFLVTLIFVLTMLFYLMRDGPRFSEYLVGTVPESYQGDMRRLLWELGRVWNAYLRGQLLLSAIMAVVVYIAASILGLPQPLVLGLLAGFLEFIPQLGPGLSQIPALLFALTTDSSTIPGLDAGLIYAAVVSVTYMALQQLEAVLLVPRVLGGSLDLHPFVVLVAIIIGASLAGVLGVVLAAPTVATLRLFLRYLRAKLLDEELFPAMPERSRQPNGLVYRLMRHLLSRRFPTLPDPALSAMRSAQHERSQRLAAPTDDSPGPADDTSNGNADPAKDDQSPEQATTPGDLSRWAL